MKNGLRVIDCEHHFNLDLMAKEFKESLTPEQWKAINGLKEQDADSIAEAKRISDAMSDLDVLRLSEMDKAGIDFAQISLTTPGA